MTRILICSLAILTLMCSPGCLLNHSRHEVIRQAEPIQRISFESEDSRNCFEGLVESAVESDDYQSHNALAIPFILALKRSQSTSEAAIRNDLAAKYDVNGDFIISDYEASLIR